MAATRSQAETCDPNALDGLITEWRTVHDTVQINLDKSGNEFRQSSDFWTGKTGDRARDTAAAAVTAGRRFTEDLQTAITTLTADRDAIWGAKNRATQAISAAVQAKYDVSDDGNVEPSHGAKVAATSSLDNPDDQGAALAALLKYGKDTFELPIKSALNDLGTAITNAGTHIQNALPDTQGVTTVAAEAPAKLDPRMKLTGDQGREDGETIADGKLSDDERARILEHLTQAGISKEDWNAIQRGEVLTVPQSTMDYLTNLYDKSGRDGLLTLSENLKNDGSSQAQQLRAGLAGGMMTLSNESVVTRDTQGKIVDRGGFGKLNSEIREIVGTRPNLAGAPDSNTRELPDDYRPGMFGPKTDHRSAILDYNADLAAFGDFINAGDPDYMPGDRLGVEMGRQAAHQAWILDHGGIGDYMGTKYPDAEALRDSENAAQSLLGAAGRSNDASYALLTGNGSDELFGKDTPGQSWHAYDHESAMGAILTHEWSDDGAAAGSLMDWVSGDATNADPTRAEHAGEAAGALAELLSTTKTGGGVNMYDTLLNMPGQENHSLGQVNPLVTRSIANSLAPYVGDIVGAPSEITGTSGFPADSVGPVDGTRIFSILDGDPRAGATINGAALGLAEKIDRNFAAGAFGGGEEQRGLGTYSGRLQALVDSGMAAEVADFTTDETARAKALADQKSAAYGVAQNLLGLTGIAGPAGAIGGPLAQAVSEYYKNPLTSVDPDLSGQIRDDYLEDSDHHGYDASRSRTIGAQNYNMMAQLIESGRVQPLMLPPDVRDVMLESSPDGSFTVKPYLSAANTDDKADLLADKLSTDLNNSGVDDGGRLEYMRLGTQVNDWFRREIISSGTSDGQGSLAVLKTDELEKKGKNNWLASW
ncbi:TPR repeat region-containing protein [Nocardia vermiculata]|uniref:TPR repeat domain-containing protein n=1 Tax=Nocardia vermiculata TaxID=257274 RepID=A0A846Y117_9NOCA|nr:hypothetical protein [Nocardia vermiculata]NKY51690.1 hypothetical protein [Nocardia vermiculata]